ncbi:MAG: SNF2-related protein, partial [Vulcanimicrobiota bacterium]
IYSAGVLLFQMLTGDSPAENFPDLPDLNHLDSELPSELKRILKQVLEPEPEKRLQPVSRFSAGISLVKSILEDSLICPGCNKNNPSGSFFCGFCGSFLKTEENIDEKPEKEVEITTSAPPYPWPSPGELRHSLLYPRSRLVARSLGFENLLTIDHNKIEEYPHQITAVHRGLKDMGGRCLLADEVGLGKTIEAGIMMDELRTRGLINSVLIIVPSHLKYQWKDEMWVKFDEKFRLYTSPGSIDFEKDKKVIISLAAASRRGKTRDAVLAKKWDLVIVDEAHHIKNRKTLRWKLIDQINKEYILLLTATPVHNQLSDLFSLISVLKPGHLKNINYFKANFMDPQNPRKVKNSEQLKTLLKDVMIRTRRADALIKFPRRVAFTRLVELNQREKKLYNEVTAYIKELSLDSSSSTPFGLVNLIQRLSSSPAAASTTLKKLSENQKLFNEQQRARWHEYYLLAREMGEPAKAGHLLDIINSASDKVVVFTDHVPTQKFLGKYLNTADITTYLYRGNSNEKKEVLEKFREGGRALIVPKSGGEGLNLQHMTNILVNYDLPWNPMKLEQRIGRLQRLGQDRDVYVFNLVGKNTVEAYILEILEEKIKMFQLAVGQLDLILGTRFEEERSFENVIWKRILSASDVDRIREEVLSVGEVLERGLQESKKVEENVTVMDQLSFLPEAPQYEDCNKV